MALADATRFSSLPLQFDLKSRQGACSCERCTVEDSTWTNTSDLCTHRPAMAAPHGSPLESEPLMALFRSDGARDSLEHVHGAFAGTIERHRSTDVHMCPSKRQGRTTADGSNQSSPTWKHNRTISKTIECITGALLASTHLTSNKTKYSKIQLFWRYFLNTNVYLHLSNRLVW